MNYYDRVVLAAIDQSPGADLPLITLLTHFKPGFVRRKLADLVLRNFVIESNGRYRLQPGVDDAIRKP